MALSSSASDCKSVSLMDGQYGSTVSEDARPDGRCTSPALPITAAIRTPYFLLIAQSAYGPHLLDRRVLCVHVVRGWFRQASRANVPMSSYASSID